MSRHATAYALLAAAALLAACDDAPLPTAAADAAAAPRRASVLEPRADTRTPNQIAIAARRLGRATLRNGTGAAIIDNGTVQLGVNAEAHLNVPGGEPSSGGETTVVGLRYLPTKGEATAPGCLCEGWGVADAGTGVSGYANESADGVVNLQVLTWETTDSTALSVVRIKDNAGAAVFEVTHDYRPARETRLLYEAVVTIRNVSDHALEDVRYRRVMDWDIPPTTFDEYVTIRGASSSGLVLYASNGGFSSGNPLGFRDVDDTYMGPVRGYVRPEGDFTDIGPNDHGALFDFGFGRLESGESTIIHIFYGAAGTEIGALAALRAVRASVYSLGQAGWTGEGDPLSGDGIGYCSDRPSATRFDPCFGATSGEPASFIFAFRLDNVRPRASAGGPYTGVLEGTPFNFNGSASTDPEGFGLTYAWEWGDGTTSVGERPSHVYAQQGAYDIRLIVSDRSGARDTSATRATVSNVAPFIRSPTGGTTVAPGRPLFLSWVWSDKGLVDGPWRLSIDWGDGATTTGSLTSQAPVSTPHTWRKKGSYPVRIRIVDKDGGIGQVTTTIVVR